MCLRLTVQSALCLILQTPVFVSTYNKETYPQGFPRGREDEKPNESINDNECFDSRTTSIERCVCGKSYSTSGSLYRHQKSCDRLQNKQHELFPFSCICLQRFKTNRGLKIHQTKMKCLNQTEKPQQRVNEALPNLNKSVEDTSPVQTHSADDLIAGGNKCDSRCESRKERIKWPAASDIKIWKGVDEDLCKSLQNSLKGNVLRKIKTMGEIIYEYGLARFGPHPVNATSKSQATPCRREREIMSCKGELKQLKKQWKQAVQEDRNVIQGLQNAVKKKLRQLQRSERYRQKRREKRKKRTAFFYNPHKFVKGLFEEAKSGTLQASKEDLEAHLKTTYSDANRADLMGEISGLKRPSVPGVPFKMTKISILELREFLRKAKSAAAPGPNGIQYKVYKMCPGLQEVLLDLLRVIWRLESLPDEWTMADGIYIPKEEGSCEISQFRPISLLNVEGKIFFGIMAKRLTDYLTVNGLVDCSIQKAGLPGFPGCVEHTSMIWHSIQEAKSDKRDLAVVWLDLANAYGSVPHRLIQYALEFFHVPLKIQQLLKNYYENFRMRFSTKDYTTNWQSLEVGIPMGCTISPSLFILAMDIMVRSARAEGEGVPLGGEQCLPAIRAFMDDLTLISPSVNGTRRMLDRLVELMNWAHMRFKPAKSRSLVLKKGKIVDCMFDVGNARIPTISEAPVKSLGRWYTSDLRDVSQVGAIKKRLKEGLVIIDSCGLPGKLKLWCWQFGLLPRIMWPFTVYEIGLSHVEAMERHVNAYLRKWMGVPPGLTTVGLYSRRAKVKLPLKALSEEFKAAKVRLFMTLRDSSDQVIRDVQPDVKTGRKWSANQAVEEAEAVLRHKDVVGSTQVDRKGLGYHKISCWSSASTKERRAMVVETIREFEEEARTSKAVGQAQQGQWTNLDTCEQRQISWNDIWKMEQCRLSFMMRCSYDQLPTHSNLARWGMRESSECPLCGGHESLQHALSACPQALGKFKWRHDQVLDSLVKAVESRVEKVNISATEKKHRVDFVPEGAKISAPLRKRQVDCVLSGTNDWVIECDIGRQLRFPIKIALTRLRPDLIIWSDTAKKIIICELTVPWEANVEDAFARKYDKYQDLVFDCQQRGWNTLLFPVEVGCRGLIARSTVRFLSAIGIRGRERRMVFRSLTESAESGSAWIWWSRKQSHVDRQ